MKHGHALSIGLAALALAACGGSGSNGGSTTGPVTPTGDYQIRAVLTDTAHTSTQDTNGGYLYPDPLSLQVGDVVTFQLVKLDSSDPTKAPQVIDSGVSYTVSGPAATGTISAPDGVFEAARDTGGTPYVVTARYNGAVFTTSYQINPVQVLLRGRVVNESTGNGVANAEVDFYGPQNLDDPTSPVVRKGIAHTAFNGTFRVSLPTSTTPATTGDAVDASAKITFTVSGASLPTGYYPSYVYKGKRYDAGSTVCQPTLQSLNAVTDTNGATVYLPFASGDRYLVNGTAENPTGGSTDTVNNGTILLTPTSKFATKPVADGCTLSP